MVDRTIDNDRSVLENRATSTALEDSDDDRPEGRSPSPDRPERDRPEHDRPDHEAGDDVDLTDVDLTDVDLVSESIADALALMPGSESGLVPFSPRTLNRWGARFPKGRFCLLRTSRGPAGSMS